MSEGPRRMGQWEKGCTDLGGGAGSLMSTCLTFPPDPIPFHMFPRPTPTLASLAFAFGIVLNVLPVSALRHGPIHLGKRPKEKIRFTSWGEKFGELIWSSVRKVWCWRSLKAMGISAKAEYLLCMRIGRVTRLIPHDSLKLPETFSRDEREVLTRSRGVFEAINSGANVFSTRHESYTNMEGQQTSGKYTKVLAPFGYRAGGFRIALSPSFGYLRRVEALAMASLCLGRRGKTIRREGQALSMNASCEMKGRASILSSAQKASPLRGYAMFIRVINDETTTSTLGLAVSLPHPHLHLATNACSPPPSPIGPPAPFYTLSNPGTAQNRAASRGVHPLYVARILKPTISNGDTGIERQTLDLLDPT
ncbi:hypothetical protein FA13DRAFT_1715755 [Coprinellus micaceus]|uniref:Uncharacterized protein n=1 Tax=Coprinellus micaceus TaxID=71717 RepID=A0A4Y7SM40_COPMI|nr:hypothetical protein FA13DRAFT_1715755 [Coprinellus micaceus]